MRRREFLAVTAAVLVAPACVARTSMNPAEQGVMYGLIGKMLA